MPSYDQVPPSSKQEMVANRLMGAFRGISREAVILRPSTRSHDLNGSDLAMASQAGFQ
jgi:hypothetical protein